MMRNTRPLREEWQRLRTLDWQALDLGEAGIWPWSIKVLGGVLVFITAFVLTGWWWGSDSRTALAGAQREEVRLLSDYRSSVHAAGELAQARDQKTVLAAQMDQVRGMLTPQADTPALLNSIMHAADANDLAIDTLQLRPSVIHSVHVEHPMDIEVLGSYHQLAQFIADLNRLPQLVTQHAFTLTPAEPQSAMLRLALVATAYDEAGAEPPQPETRSAVQP